jgi:Phosphotransferase enzyme family
MTTMLEETVRQINAQYGTNFRLLGRYPVGETGAFRLVDGAGTRFVLKWSPQPAHLPLVTAAARASEQLRSLGYPAPSYVLWGALPEGCFGVQHALPGRPRRLAEPAIVDQLVALCDLHAGRGGWLAEVFPARPPWAEEAVHAVMHGYAEHDYCILGSLRAYSPAAAELLRVVQAFVEQHADEMGVADHTDIVHFDFSPANLLLDERQRVLGVVDWEGVRAGDRLFDLATLLFYLPVDGEAHQRLRRAALERGRPGVLGIYLSHLVVRQVDFSIRHHGPTAVERWLAHTSGLVASLEELA